MEPINLDPRYTSAQLPGKCLKCLAEQQLDGCLRLLLVDQGEEKELQERYSALLSFLKSPRSKKLRDETEKYLAEGKDVSVKIFSQGRKMKYEINIGEVDTKESN
jgi:hypothetical protein